MEPVFWYKLSLSFITGGIWVCLSTLAAERFGSRSGGLIGGLPSTAAVALFFMGLTQSPSAAAEAATIIPLAQGLNGLFIVTYLAFVRHGLVRGLAAGLGVWFLLAAALLALNIRSLAAALAGWLILTAVCWLLVEKWMRIPSTGKIQTVNSPLQLFGRVLFGGLVIAAAVLLGKIAGAGRGGIFAAFPAMFISTLVITYRTGGAGFSRAVAKALMISGLINVALYAVAVKYFYPAAGLLPGTAMSICVSLITGYLTSRILKSRAM